MADRSPAAGPHLRALDWRFLLPPAPSARARRLVVLGGQPGIDRLAIGQGLAGTVAHELPDDASADLVVVEPGAWAEPLALARALAPGGSLFVEADRRALPACPSLGAATRRLERAGLTVTATYLVVPSPAGPRDYLPLDAPGAPRWYVRNVHRPVLRTQRVTAAIVARLPAWCTGRLASQAPTYAIVARRAGGAPADDGPAALAPARAAGLASRGARALVMGAGGDRVVVLPFAGDAHRPEVVLKVPRAPGLRARSTHEQEVLRTLRADLPASLAAALPEPLGILEDDQAWTAVERYVPGRSLLASSGSRGAGNAQRLADLRLAAGWLESFHRATERRRVPWGGEPRAKWLDGCVDRYRSLVGASAAEEALFDAARIHSDRLAHLPCPTVCQHRDFAIWNLARNHGGLVVLDWEGTRDGPPLCDLLHLVISWDLVIRRPAGTAAGPGRMETLLLDGRRGDLLEAAARETVTGYLARMEIDRRLAPLLLLHHCLELAIRRADQLRDHGADGGWRARDEDGPAAAVAMLAGNVEALFGDGGRSTAFATSAVAVASAPSVAEGSGRR